jgi:formylglycine-generating enzyme required for sulfatase activity
MEFVKQEQDSDGIVMRVSRDELATIGNALNESLEAIEEWEFAARMGATREEVEALLDALARLDPPADQV